MSYESARDVWGRRSVALFMTAVMALALAPAGTAMAEADTTQPAGQATASSLDADHLADGEYLAYARMINYSNGASSMSDAAIDHAVKISVKNGAYTATVGLQGIAIGTSFGYMQHFYYWDGSDFTETTVNSTYDVIDYFNADKLVKDSEGNEIPAPDAKAKFRYPSSVSFPLVSKAAGDERGFVKMRVFVPIMEGINRGSGTQLVYMAIDWSSIEKSGSQAHDDLWRTATAAAQVEQEGSPETDAAYADLQAAIYAAKELLAYGSSDDSAYGAAKTRIEKAQGDYGDAYERYAESRREVFRVQDLVSALPPVSRLTVKNKAAVASARAAYDALSASQQQLVSESTLERLSAAEKRIAQLEQQARLVKKANPAKASAMTKAVKYKKVKRKAQKVKIKVTRAQGKVSFKPAKKSGKYRKVSVSKKGTVTFKRGAKKGTYSFKVSVSGNAGYQAKTLTVKIRVR